MGYYYINENSISLKNGIKLQQEEYTHMSQEHKNLLEETLNELRLIAIEVDKKLLKLNKQMGDELDTRIAESIIEDCMELLYNTSFKSEEYGEIMETVKQHILVKLQKYNFILNAQTYINGNIFKEK